MSEPGLDEMVDGQGGMRPQWRSVLGTIFGLGREGLAERATTLKRVMAEEGASSLLPGAEGAWRCDPIPLPLAASEFNAIATGLALIGGVSCLGAAGASGGISTKRP